MPIEFRTSLELDLLFARWSGVIGLQEFQGNYLKYLNDAHYKRGRRELLDLSRVTHFNLGFEQVRAGLRQVVASMADTPEIVTRTVVWAPYDDAFATARMYQQLAETGGSIAVETYREERSALTALDLDYANIGDLLAAVDFIPYKPRADDSVSPGSGSGAA